MLLFVHVLGYTLIYLLSKDVIQFFKCLLIPPVVSSDVSSSILLLLVEAN